MKYLLFHYLEALQLELWFIMDKIHLTLPTVTPVNITDLFINLAFCVIAAFLLRALYVRKSISLSGKFHIGTVIPILAVVTFLVIMVVKSSLALSLGLVGALSVIRFRTPIKEPEELVYLFLAIAIGLGYGAGQAFVTTIVFITILLLIVFWLSRKNVTHENEYNLLIDWTGHDDNMKDILERVGPHVRALELRKYTDGEQEKSMFLKVEAMDITDIDALVKSVTRPTPGIVCTVHEARPLQ